MIEPSSPRTEWERWGVPEVFDMRGMKGTPKPPYVGPVSPRLVLMTPQQRDAIFCLKGNEFKDGGVALQYYGYPVEVREVKQ